MAEHRIAILNRIAVADAGIELVCNNPTDTIRFEFDKEWSGITAKTARFSWDGKYIDVPFSGNAVKVPEIFQTHYVYVGVFAKNITSTPAKVKCRYSIKCLGGKNAPPSNDVYAQIMELLNADLTNSKAVEGRVSSLENYEHRPYEVIGNPVQFENYEGMPLNLVTVLEPKQYGSGDPSPTNIRLFTGYDALGLTHAGKNLAPHFASETKNGVTLTAFDDGSVSLTGTYESNTGFIGMYDVPLPPGTYIISANNPEPATDEGLFISAYDETSTIIQAINMLEANRVYKLTTEKAIKQIRLRGPVGLTVDNFIIKLQVERDSTATEFVKSQSKIYALRFDETVYGGRIDWNMGRLVADIGFKILTGNETYTAASNGIVTVISDAAAPIVGGVEAWCSHYKRTAATGVSGIADGEFAVSHKSISSTARLYIRDSANCPDVSTGQAYIAAQNAAGTPVQVAYKLATPVEIPLTPHEISALRGVNTLYGDGEIKVSGRKDILWLTSSLIERIKTLEEAVVSLGGNV